MYRCIVEVKADSALLPSHFSDKKLKDGREKTRRRRSRKRGEEKVGNDSNEQPIRRRSSRMVMVEWGGENTKTMEKEEVRRRGEE